MPIIINDDNSVQILNSKGVTQTKKRNNTPKFFHSALTGNGAANSRGFLSEEKDPKMYPNGYRVRISGDIRKSECTNGMTKIINIPCYVISEEMWKYITTYNRPSVQKMVKIAQKYKSEIWMTAPIHAVQIQEERIPSSSDPSKTVIGSKELFALMNVMFFCINDQSNTEHTRSTLGVFNDTIGNVYSQQCTSNIFATLKYAERTLTANGYTVDKTAMNDFVQNYSLFHELSDAVDQFTDDIDTIVSDTIIKNIAHKTNTTPNAKASCPDAFAMDLLKTTLTDLEKYNVPLDKYQTMFNKMNALLDEPTLNEISKSNLNLKLSNTLHHMDMNKPKLQFCPCNVHIQTKIPYSIEQREAIETTSPLTLVQSGAGTGKSTVILGRIEHMIANGVNPEDITVLSFTNAAANHITDLRPDIHSMTIASMLHAIYSNNYPTHQLSSVSTIINSLDIYYGRYSHKSQKEIEFAQQFSNILERLRDNSDYTNATNFVCDNIDDVISVLDTIKQTSLEIEGIVCYQKMDTLVEPPETKTKHLIIDEVQDNSISEFIYSIKYTDKHLCSLYIVGDCSQTLYEFRASNPKALNVLENSGVFQTYKLQTNYRSNQEILDFANILLNDIEANQYAKIQLKANSLRPVTSASFQDAVNITHFEVHNKTPDTINNMIEYSLKVDMDAYIKSKLNNKEKICILAHRRKELNFVKETLEKIYPDKKIISLIPQRPKDTTVFSKFIASYWDKISYTPPANVMTIIKREIFSKIDKLIFRNTSVDKRTIAELIIRNTVKDFETECGHIVADLQKQVMMSAISQDEMMDEIKKLMISFEIRRNAIAQTLVSNKNADAKSEEDIESADFILSTIHSAKGLEFDNVITYYKYDSVIDEADKRMYYVAFTRAKKSEYIYSYGHIKTPGILKTHKNIVANLNKIAAVASSGNNADTDADADMAICSE